MANKKGINKIKAGFSVDSNVWIRFESFCKDRDINKSKLLSRIIRDFVDEHQTEKKLY